MNIQKLNEVLKDEISNLVDYDVGKLNSDTPFSDIGLTSLDFVSIQVAIKKELGFVINLGDLAGAGIVKYGDFLNFIENQHNASNGSKVA